MIQVNMARELFASNEYSIENSPQLDEPDSSECLEKVVAYYFYAFSALVFISRSRRTRYHRCWSSGALCTTSA